MLIRAGSTPVARTINNGRDFSLPLFIEHDMQGSKGSGSELTVRGTVKSRGRPSAVEARDRPLSPAPEKSTLQRGFFNSIRLRRVILLRSYIRLTPSDIALRAVIRRIEYNCSEGAISLSAPAENITLPSGRISLKREKTTMSESILRDRYEIRFRGFLPELDW